MTKSEIRGLIKHHEKSETYSVYYAGIGFHGNNLEWIIRELDALLCQVPGCGNERCERKGRKAYLCPKHFTEAIAKRLEN